MNHCKLAGVGRMEQNGGRWRLYREGWHPVQVTGYYTFFTSQHAPFLSLDLCQGPLARRRLTWKCMEICSFISLKASSPALQDRLNPLQDTAEAFWYTASEGGGERRMILHRSEIALSDRYYRYITGHESLNHESDSLKDAKEWCVFSLQHTKCLLFWNFT